MQKFQIKFLNKNCPKHDIKRLFCFVQALKTLKAKEIIVWEDFKHGGSLWTKKKHKSLKQ